jgi:hypothetical protein
VIFRHGEGIPAPPHFYDQDVDLILVASIEHFRLLRGAAKSDG